MSRHGAFVCLLSGLLWPGVLSGQTSCADSETLAQCWSRVTTVAVQEEVAADGEDAEATASDRLLGKSTGIGALGSGLASSLNDFLPLLAGNLGLTQTTTEDGGAAFETNLLLPFGTQPQRVKLQALLRQPSLYQPLADALPDSTREVRTTELEKELNDFDDVELSATWNLESRSFGRSFEKSRYLYAAYFNRSVTEVLAASETQAELRQGMARLIASFPETDLIDPARADDAACEDAEAMPANAPLDCFLPAVRALVVPAALAAADLVVTREHELRDALAEGGLYEFVDLVNNQPQLNLEGAVNLGDDLVGPSQFSFKLRYESGFSNVNGLRGFCHAQGLAETDPHCLSGYLAKPGVRPSIHRGDRFFLSVEYAHRSDYRIALPADQVNLSLSGTWDLVGSFGVGRYVAVNRKGEEVGRVDLAGEYVYHHDDPERENRFVATATYTQRLSGSLLLAAGFSWASKPEFLGAVDKKVSANFGLRYKFLRD